jgi:hypothetical protein
VSEGVKALSLDELITIAAHLNTAQVITRGGALQGAVGTGAVSRGKTLAEQVAQAAQNGKVVDVSGMDATTGKGGRLQVKPKSNKSGKFGVATVPIISNDLNKFVAALRILRPTDADQFYAAEIALMSQVLQPRFVPGLGAPMLQVGAAPPPTVATPVGGSPILVAPPVVQGLPPIQGLGQF